MKNLPAALDPYADEAQADSMNAMSPEIHELLTAIRDALDLPYAAGHDAWCLRQELRGDNAVRVVSALTYVLDQDATDVSVASRMLRAGLAENPVDYAIEDEHSGEPGR